MIQFILRLSGLLLCLLGFSVHASTLTFVDKGYAIKTIAVDDLAKVSEIKSVIVDNPTDSSIRSYQGFSLISILNSVFTSKWKDNDIVKFIATDGYQAIIPVSVINQHNGIIAIGENSQRGFSKLLRRNAVSVDPGPFYLVWENIQDVSAKKESWLSWPWQLTRIELTSFKYEYPHSTPPSTSSRAVKKGFLAFQQHCIKCHTVNGDGGNIGPELNYPVSVTEYWQPIWLSRFIDDPKSVRSNSTMIPFYRDVENRERQIADIINYMKIMAKNKFLNKQ